MSAPQILDAILPAGGRLKPELAEKVGTDVKALIEIDGKPILESVLDAIEASGLIRRTVLIAGAEVKARYGSRVTMFLDEAETGPDNMYNGLTALSTQPDPPHTVLLSTTDLPYIEGEHIKRPIEMANTGKQIAVPLIRRSAFEQAYPGTESTFVKLKDGEFTLGGAFLIEADAMRRMRPHVEKVFEQRKSKIGMAKLLGLGFVMRFLSHSLTLTDVENKIVSLLDCTGSALPDAPVEFAYDIDDWDDYSYAVGRQVPA